MNFPIVTHNEKLRQQILDSYRIVDTAPEREFDDIAMIAAQICKTPVCFISIIDHQRQWMKVAHGIKMDEIPRRFSFCNYAIKATEEFMMVPDLNKDLRFKENPLVVNDPHVVFYASAQLISPEGQVLGTLCVMDNKERRLSIEQQYSLIALARQVMSQLVLRKKNFELTETKTELESANEELKRFAQVLAHDLKNPIQGIRTDAESLMRNIVTEKMDTLRGLEMIRNRSLGMEQLVNGMLQYARTGGMQIIKEQVSFNDAIQSTLVMLDIPENMNIRLGGEPVILNTDEILLKQMLLNLIGNAIKYNDKTEGNVYIHTSATKKQVTIEICDNGPGIPEQHINSVFEIFKTLGRKDRYGNKGTGIGLATVRRIASKLNAEIIIDADYRDGARFILTFYLMEEPLLKTFEQKKEPLSIY